MQGIESNADAILITFQQAQRTVEKEFITIRKRDTVILEAPNADLWPLQVTHDADLTATGFVRRPEKVSPAFMISRCAMGKIKARNIKACLDHVTQYIYVV
jgi:hypothetical protein